MEISLSLNRDRELRDVLRSAIRAIILESPNTDLVSNTTDVAWRKNADRLCQLVLSHDPQNFLQWDVLLRTMVIGNAEYVQNELKYLQGLPDWNNRWKNAITESPIGNPTFYDDFLASSGTLIHNAYHLAQFENKFGMDISKAPCIFEFGGGYGCMCRLVHSLKFKGKYIIYDLPPLSALQQYFLNMNGISLINFQAGLEKGFNFNGVICISELEQLEAILAAHINNRDSVFIANWSISESPINLRQTILESVKSFDAFLVAYQGHFGDTDNLRFFKEWIGTMKNIEWHNWKIAHLPNQFYKDNYYLMGKKMRQDVAKPCF